LKALPAGQTLYPMGGNRFHRALAVGVVSAGMAAFALANVSLASAGPLDGLSGAGSSDDGGIGSPIGLPPLVGDTVETVAGVTSPVLEDVGGPLLTETAGPLVSDVAAPVVVTVTAPLDEALAPVLEEAAPILEPVTRALEPVTGPLLTTVEETAGPVVDPLLVALDPVTDPVIGVVEPTSAPVTAPVADILGPVTTPVFASVPDTSGPLFVTVPEAGVLSSHPLPTVPAAIPPARPDALVAQPAPSIFPDGVSRTLPPMASAAPAQPIAFALASAPQLAASFEAGELVTGSVLTRSLTGGNESAGAPARAASSAGSSATFVPGGTFLACLAAAALLMAALLYAGSARERSLRPPSLAYTPTVPPA
jgi:hypothetical protein